MKRYQMDPKRVVRIGFFTVAIVAGFLLVIGFLGALRSEDFKEIVTPYVSGAVFIGGFANAFALLLQALKLHKYEDPRSFSLPMFWVFLFIQFSLAANALIGTPPDWWQASGMLASMSVTTWILVMIYKYR